MTKIILVKETEESISTTTSPEIPAEIVPEIKRAETKEVGVLEAERLQNEGWIVIDVRRTPGGKIYRLEKAE